MCDLIKKDEFFIFYHKIAVSLFTSEWIEIEYNGADLSGIAVSLFTSEWIEM